jgi:hypothetical protein
MKPVFNYLMDLRKIGGGSAEMFWKGGWPGLAIETQPGLIEKVDFDAAAVREEMDRHQNGLQRYIALIGMTARTLEVQITDPKNYYETQMRLITATLAVPWRVFMGSEAAQLAGEQDTINWNTRLNSRRQDFCSPGIIRPFIKRMMELGVLPQPATKVKIDWEDLNTPSDLDRAKVADLITKALATYVQVRADEVLPIREFMRHVLNFKPSLVDAVLDVIGDDPLADRELEDVNRLLKESGPSTPPED